MIQFLPVLVPLVSDTIVSCACFIFTSLLLPCDHAHSLVCWHAVKLVVYFCFKLQSVLYYALSWFIFVLNFTQYLTLHCLSLQIIPAFVQGNVNV